MSFTLLASGYGGLISTLALDTAAGTFNETSTISSGNAPTWLTLHDKHPVVYTGDEFSSPDGDLYSFRVGTDGHLTRLNTAKVGEGPVHFAVNQQGSSLYSANYGSGTLSVVGLNQDGSFKDSQAETFKYVGTGPNKERQEAPHVHGVYVDPTGDFLFATDLGGDQLKVYKIEGDAVSARPSITLPAGNGPRHLAITAPSASQSKTLLYLVEELTSTLAIFEVLYPTTPDGPLALAAIQTELSVLPPDASSFAVDWTAAELALSADRRFLYVSNRAPLDPHPEADTLTIFELNGEGGVVTAVPPTYFSLGGRGPRHFSLSPKKDGQPEGKYMAVALQRTNEVVVYEVKGKELTEVARVKDIKEPTAVVWL
ncbi:hypothetical protein JCM8097_004054 [Rhodosporidiobolus ruineniae]